MSELTPIVRRLAAELLDQLRASRRAAQPPEQPPPPTQSLWQRVPTFLELTRKITVNLVIIIVGGILIAVTAKAAFEPLVTFESIQLPAQLVNSGYGANVLAERVLDQMHAIRQMAMATKEASYFGVSARSESVSDKMFFGTMPQYEALSAIQVPSSALNLRSIVLLLRDLIKPDDIRVAGDLTVLSSQAPPLYVLQLRYSHGVARQTRTVKGTDLDLLIAAAAEAVLDLSDAHTLASYHYNRKAWPQVDEILDRVLANAPEARDARWALNLRGQRLLDLDRHNEAIDCFEQVTKLDSSGTTFVSSWISSSSKTQQPGIPYANWGNALLRKGDYASAIEKYRQAAKLDPKYAGTYYNWGKALEAMRDYNGAIEKYKRTTELDPTYAPAFNNWGIVLRINADFDGAIEKYRRAIQLDPKYALAFNNWGVALRNQKDYGGAIEKYQRAIEIDPNYAIAFNSWGVALEATQKYDEAVEKYRRAIELEPKYAQPHYNWGNDFLRSGDYQKAAAKYERATELDPKYASAFNNWGIALERSKDYDGAIEKFERATELDPRHKNAFNAWGVTLSLKQDYDGAIEKFKQATEIDPTYALAFRNWGDALKAKGDSAGAAERYQRAKEIKE